MLLAVYLTASWCSRCLTGCPSLLASWVCYQQDISCSTTFCNIHLTLKISHTFVKSPHWYSYLHAPCLSLVPFPCLNRQISMCITQAKIQPGNEGAIPCCCRTPQALKLFLEGPAHLIWGEVWGHLSLLHRKLELGRRYSTLPQVDGSLLLHTSGSLSFSLFRLEVVVGRERKIIQAAKKGWVWKTQAYCF